MKKLIYIFSLLAASTGLLQSGCQDDSVPQRIYAAFGTNIGSASLHKKPSFTYIADWHGMTGEVKVYCTPVTYTVWKVDFITTASSTAQLEYAIYAQWHCRPDRSGTIHLPHSTIVLSPEYTRGPQGIRLSITDHKSSSLNKQENALPEVILSRQRRQAVDDIMLVEEALEHFFTDNGIYPRILSELAENLLQRSKWHGPYIEKIPLDPWHNNYIYRSSSDGKSYEFFSGGKNGREKIR